MEHKSLIAFALVLQAGTKSFKDGFALISYLMAVQTHDFQRKGNLQATRLRSYLPTDGNSCNQQHTSTTDPDSGQVTIVQQPVFLVVIVYLVDMLDNLQAFPTIPTTDVICFIILYFQNLQLLCFKAIHKVERSLTLKLYEEIILVFVISFHSKFKVMKHLFLCEVFL